MKNGDGFVCDVCGDRIPVGSHSWLQRTPPKTLTVGGVPEPFDLAATCRGCYIVAVQTGSIIVGAEHFTPRARRWCDIYCEADAGHMEAPASAALVELLRECVPAGDLARFDGQDGLPAMPPDIRGGHAVALFDERALPFTGMPVGATAKTSIRNVRDLALRCPVCKALLRRRGVDDPNAN